MAWRITEHGEETAMSLPDSMHPILSSVHYLHGLFDPCFLEQLEELRTELPGDWTSQNMRAVRRRFESTEIAQNITRRLPLGLRVLPSMRFIEYPLGGFIAAHTDGPSFDEKAQSMSTHTMLLYLQDSVEAGSTHILDDVSSREPLARVEPTTGSILVFPHEVAHRGDVVSSEGKVLLRGDLIRQN